MLTDQRIAELIAEKKSLPENYLDRLRPQQQVGQIYTRGSLSVVGDNGSHFRINTRKSTIDMRDFSIVFIYEIQSTNQEYVIARYNGDHGEHQNTIEKETVEGFHIHKATERYQKAGKHIESYAVETDSYGSFTAALGIFINDMNFTLPGLGKYMGGE
ncbi:MAG: hypothetical protein WCK39_01745 [Methanomassiliicoccales archaeon]